MPSGAGVVGRRGRGGGVVTGGRVSPVVGSVAGVDVGVVTARRQPEGDDTMRWRREGGRCVVACRSDVATCGSWFPARSPTLALRTCSGSTASSSTTRGATRRSSPRCSASSPTASRGPSCGSAPIRTARPRSTTAARSRDLTGELPYLLKVLAAAEPLSLQAHPDAEQARDGFERGRLPGPQRRSRSCCAR